MSTTLTKTFRVRVKDKHIPLLQRMASEVSAVWNYCNQANRDTYRKHRQHLTGFDLNKLCAGSTTAFELIGDSTIQEVGQEYASKRRKSGKSRLRWRSSNRNRRNYSLGWVPFKSRAAAWKDGHVRFAGHSLHVWDSYGLGNYNFRAGCFAEDACGNWFFCINIQVQPQPSPDGEPIGIDLDSRKQPSPLTACAAPPDGTESSKKTSPPHNAPDTNSESNACTEKSKTAARMPSTSSQPTSFAPPLPSTSATYPSNC